MATAQKNTTLAPASTALTTLYTVPALTTADIKSLTAENISNAPAKFTLSYFDSSGAVTRELDEVTLPPHGHKNLIDDIGDLNMETADALKVTCTVASVLQFDISVIETS